MTKLCLSSAAIAILLGVSAAAQSQYVSAHKKHTNQEPAAQTTAVPPDPIVVQKWFSGAVDDILTNTDKTLGGLQGTER